MKKCSKCKDFLDLSNFYKSKKGKNGLRASCKACMRLQDSKYRNSAEGKAVKGEWLQKNSNHIKASRKVYYSKNSDEIKSRSVKHRVKNAENVKAVSVEYYKNNKEVIKAKTSEYQKSEEGKAVIKKNYNNKIKTDSVFKCKDRVSKLVRKGLSKRGYNKQSQTNQILGCDYIYFYNHLCSTFELNYGIGREFIPWDDIHIDHIIPLAEATNKESIYQLNYYTNLQLLMSYDNLSKSSRLEWSIYDIS